MSFKLRVLIESIASACLNAITSANAKPISASVNAKVAILRFGSACVSTPWPSGASSSVLDQLWKTAMLCRMQDAKTCSASICALRLCASLGAPRVPALYLDKQVYDFSDSHKSMSANFLANQVQCFKKQQHNQEGAIIVEETVGEDGHQPTKRRKESHPRGDITGLGVEAKALKDYVPALPKKEHDSTEISPPAAPAIQSQNTSMSAGEDDEDVLPDIMGDGGPDEEDA